MTNTKDNLIDTAIMMFWIGSYGSVSVDDICKQSGVKKGSFYHFFPSKVDLAVEAFGKLWQMGKTKMDEAFSPTLTPTQKIKRYAELTYERQKELKEETGKVLGCPFTNCGSEMCSQEERIREIVMRIYDDYQKYFESLAREALGGSGDAKLMAEEMTSYVLGVMSQAKIKNDLEIIRRDLASGLLKLLESAKSAELAS